MEQAGSGDTVRTTSSTSVQPLACTAVNRSVAVAEETWAAVIKESGESIVAEPATTLQVVEEMGFVPAVATPLSAKLVEEPSVHRVWSGPALTLGPMRKGY